MIYVFTNIHIRFRNLEKVGEIVVVQVDFWLGDLVNRSRAVLDLLSLNI